VVQFGQEKKKKAQKSRGKILEDPKPQRLTFHGSTKKKKKKKLLQVRRRRWTVCRQAPVQYSKKVNRTARRRKKGILQSLMKVPVKTESAVKKL